MAGDVDIILIDLQIRKGAKDAIEKFVGKKLSYELEEAIKKISAQGGTPLIVVSAEKPLGVVFFKDIIFKCRYFQCFNYCG